MVNGFSVSFRLNRNRNGGGIMIYICYNILSKLLVKHVLPSDIERLFIELNFRKFRCFLFKTYQSPSQSNPYYFNNLDKALGT